MLVCIAIIVIYYYILNIIFTRNVDNKLILLLLFSTLVISPGVVDELCTSKVMVTEWIDGTRLDRDSSADVPRLCGLAVNAYLTMLLDTGVLHCE